MYVPLCRTLAITHTFGHLRVRAVFCASSGCRAGRLLQHARGTWLLDVPLMLK
jgi:hypothetical protein